MSDVSFKKQDFKDIYNYKDSSLYYQLGVHNLGGDDRFEAPSFYLESVLSEQLLKVWQREMNKPLHMVDVLSGYGADTLLYTRAFNKQDFAKMWGTPGNLYNIHKPPLFPVKTFGCDSSQNALQYGKDAGIYDENVTVDFNNMTPEVEMLLHEKCREANIFATNSIGYLNDGVFEKLVEWFAEGTEPGLFAIGFVYPFDGVEGGRAQKCYLLGKLDFFNSLPVVYRSPTKDEEQLFEEYHVCGRMVYETWYLTRRCEQIISYN
ncbi:uncharacterized protein LOC142343998 isoform X1 [Convolutriloba macropyga]|uniref:uncharacterized protein LOC142343998 isoform X1 n=1 Tax=Convolutriloba macropyga TaxID=536237 RepID=UPI003F51EF6A